MPVSRRGKAYSNAYAMCASVQTVAEAKFSSKVRLASSLERKARKKSVHSHDRINNDSENEATEQ